jgi:hypothetical protein
MRKPVAFLFLFVSVTIGFDKQYTTYNSFLKTYVCEGGVAYKQIKDDPDLKKIQQEFGALTKEQYEAFSDTEKIAYLINAYNFYTIVLIEQHHPLKKGIRDIDKPWKQKFIPLLGDTVSLDYIEHEVLRKKFDEPRIHVALVCASESCPALIDDAFTGENLDQQLQTAAKKFLTDTSRNRIKGNKLLLSEIFKWYGSDFKNKYGDYKAFVKQTLNLTDKYKVKFLPYDWSLNEVDDCK